jgi:hypothetical protein
MVDPGAQALRGGEDRREVDAPAAMARTIRFVAAIIVILLVVGVVGLLWLDFRSEQSPSQALFRQGAIPRPLPDGDYKGSVAAYSGDWIGKTFDARRAMGKNLFRSANGVEQRYPFKTLVGPGLADPVQVLKIDYDIQDNPAWLRGILDEIVQVGPGHYLGRIHLRLGSMHLSVGYFELKK